jgi:SPP1 gp7 family putative phage head morphogenesis protein
MKTEITKEGGAQVRVTGPSRKLEVEFQGILSGMVRVMSERFKNNTFKKMNKGTLEKFEDSSMAIESDGETFVFKDAQVGNYAAIFLAMSKKSRKMILKQFSDKRIKAIITGVLMKASKDNAKALYGNIEKITGISASQLAAKEAMKAQTNALILETVEWSTKLRDDALQSFTANSLRGMSQGMGIDEIIENFDMTSKGQVAKSKMVARTQLSTFNSLLTKVRAQNLGITRAVWITSEDERVRPAHEVRNGKEFELDTGLYSSKDSKNLLPGVDYNCRCDYRLIIPSD